MAGFTKLFSSLIFSTVWREELHVKVVWITMLAMANRHGDVLASVPGLADAARVPLAQCRDALTKLAAPDPDSRTKTHEGRRIADVDGGWRLLNYEKYRAIRDADERRLQTRDAVRRHRARRKVSNVSPVSQGKPRKPGKAQAEAEAEADTQKSKALVELRSTPSSPLAAVATQTAQRRTVEAALHLAAETVFVYWQAKLGHPHALLDRKRQARIEGRLRENGGNVSELLYAVDGALRDDWLMGRDAKAPRRYDGIETVFRDRAQVERLVATVPGRNGQHPFLAQPVPA